MKIFKTAFDPSRIQDEPGSLTIPSGAKFLSAQVQLINRYQKISIWYAIPDGTSGFVDYAIHGIATGEQFPAAWAEHYISTLQFGDGSYIMHIFAVPK